MLEFSEWVLNDKKRIYIQSACIESVWIEQLKRSGIAKVRCKLTAEAIYQTKQITDAGFDFSCQFASWELLRDALFALPGNHLHAGERNKQKRTSFPDQQSKAFLAPFTSVVDLRSSEAISDDSYSYSISSAPFKSSSISSCRIVVDTREPESLFLKLSEGRISIERQTLEVGDIKLVSIETKDHIIIERKTVTDFYSSITEPDHRAHSQAERLFDYQQACAAEGIRVTVIWLIEGEHNGKRMLYNCLPKSNQMDGMINYLVAILGQHVMQAFNLHHLCYLVTKLLQGYFEQELYYPVRSSTGAQIDRKKMERKATQISSLGIQHHGATIPGRPSLFHILTSFPNIDSRIAIALIDSGLVLREIMCLTKDQLIKFNGIGKVLAEKIEQDFNM